MTKDKEEKIRMNRIKVVLAELNISQKALAEMVNKTPNTITRICNNESQPTVKFLRDIAIALEVNVQELLVPTPAKTRD
ncbi:helix-turn-helix transcriptional regulator [Fluviicola sp.]|uniref:helix-turn-helix transcriptional regulator n=1 Tax=Fluviicola sp. TaxID=1917219 RepID=UPI0031D30C8C